MSQKTAKELEQEKKQRTDAIAAAQKAFDEFQLDGPEAVAQKFALQTALLEAKAADAEKNQEEMIESIKAAAEEAKGKDAETIAAISSRLETTIKAFELLQARVKSEGRQPGSNPEAKKSFNDILAETIEESAATLKSIANSKGAFDETLQMKDVGDMSISGNFPGATPWIQDPSTRLIETPYNRIWIADLLPQGTTNSNSIIYPKENGGEGGAAVWTDQTQNKAQMDFDLTSQSAYVKWIAGYVIVYRDMLDDIPWLTTYLRNKMLISLKTAENNFVLNGTGDTNPVDGLLDVATAYNGSYTNPVEVVIDANFGQIPAETDSFYRGNLTILHPRDLVKIGLNRATGGSEEFDLPMGSVSYAGGRLSLAGIRTVDTTVMTQGTFLALDTAATTFIRRLQPEIRVFEDATLAKKNQVMFRIEERATLAVFNDDAIVAGSLEGGSPA